MKNVEHFRELLLRKEHDLTAEIAGLTESSRTSGEPDTGDRVDEATAQTANTVTRSEAAVLTDLLAQTSAALRRIEDGSYGRCTSCGRPIAPARLEAVPWTPYCLEDQEKLDRASAPSGT